MEMDRFAVPDISKQLKEQDARRHRDPDAVDLKSLGLPRVWVAYRWNASKKTWFLLGFVRYPHLSKRRIARLRKKFDVSVSTIIQVVDLFEAQRTGGPKSPPVASSFDKPWSMPALKLEKHKGRIVRRRAETSADDVRFIVVADQRLTEKRKGPVYLGPLFARTLAGAKREAKRLFKAYAKIIVYDLKALGKFGKRLRRRIQKGRLKAGVTTLVMNAAPRVKKIEKAVKKLIESTKDDLAWVGLEMAGL